MSRLSSALLIGALFMLCSAVLAQNLDTLVMPGKVIEGHAKYEVECKNCHERFNKAGQSKLCLDCHKDVAKDVNDKKGYHGKQTSDKACKECHTEHKGRDAKIATFDEAKFDHNGTDYPLKNAHANTAKVKCVDCHKAGKKYRDAPSPCNDCHKKDDIHKGSLGPLCEDCHKETKWKEATFDHDKTKFPLKGKHIKTECKECHPNQKFKGVPLDCYGCHKKDDKHKGSLGTKCETCHIEKDWKTAKFDHDKETKFPLKGKHAEIKCDACHKDDPTYKRLKLGLTCIECHKKDDKHKGRYGEKCQDCHNEKDWKTITFDHDRDTKYPLKDAHKKVKCDSCHTGDLYKDKLKESCISCHKKDDKHKGRYGDKCESCHNEKDWKTITFDHERETKYALKGKHSSTKCDDCHKAPLYTKPALKTECIACHRKDDKHKGRYSDKCENCHTEKDWKTITFDHLRDTKYALKGKHDKIKCDACHKAVMYTKPALKTECIACHKKDDKHEGQEGSNCEKCHDEREWKIAKFDHNISRFPLLGKHQNVECKKCHLTLRYKDAKLECVACHTKDDVHKKLLGPKCEQCHNARDWRIWDFDHDKTKFPLDGGHKNVACIKCHDKPADKDLRISVVCYTCHTKDDVHDGSFGKQCERCHITANWKDLKPGSGFSK